MKPPKTVLTGDRPTGKLHLGHYIGSIQNRLKLQDEADQSFYMIADLQALTDNADNPEKVRNNVTEVTLDNLACGLDPAKTIFFIQSQVPAISELTVLFLNLVTLARLRRNPTVKNEMTQKGFGEDVPVGFLAYPISQAADILFAKANMVPVGEDQLPVLEQTNEIVQKFNSLYGKLAKDGKIFDKVTPILPPEGERRVPGIDGNAKMSKSLNNAIYLSDSDEQIAEKVMAMYTDPGHIHVEQPGKVEGNIVFSYLDIFDQEKAKVAELKAHYEKGGLGDVVIKKRLTGILQELISPIRDRREKLAENPKLIMEILEDGSKKARKVGEETLAEVKAAVKIDYF